MIFCSHAQPGMKMLDITEGSRVGRSRSDSIGKRLMEELDHRSWLVGAGREAERSLIWENWGHRGRLKRWKDSSVSDVCSHLRRIS